jgi:hypothetical protein
MPPSRCGRRRLAEHAAGGGDVGHRQLGPTLDLLAEPGKLSGDRARQSNQDIRPRWPAERGGNYDNGQCDQMAHDNSSRNTEPIFPTRHSSKADPDPLRR